MFDPRTVIFRRVRQLTSLLHGTLPACQRMRWQLAAETALAKLDNTQCAALVMAWDGTAPGFENTLTTVAPVIREGLVFRYHPDELTWDDDEDEDEDGDEDKNND